MRKRRRPQARRRLSKVFPSRYLVITRKNISWIVLAVGVIGFVLAVFFGAFSIKEISCKEDSESCSQEVVAELNRLKGRSLVTFRGEPVARKLKDARPDIDDISLSASFPHALRVEMTTRQAAVAVQTPNAREMLVADEHGFVFRKGRANDVALPIIIVESLSQSGVGRAITDPVAISAIALAVLMKEHFIGFREIRVEGRTIIVVLSEGGTALFSQESNLVGGVTSLQRILSEVTISSESPQIDLRHEKPVLMPQE